MVCCQKVSTHCPASQSKRPLGIDPTKGIGTAYEGYVKVPKHGVVKRGWIRQFVVVCDFKLFLYDITSERSSMPSVHITQVLDMRDSEFGINIIKTCKFSLIIILIFFSCFKCFRERCDTCS